MGIYQLPKIIGKDKKPSLGARINWHHPLSQGLVGAWLLNEGGGTNIYDVVRGVTLNITNNASWEKNGILCDANDEGAVVTTPPHLKINKPISIALGFIQIASVSSYAIYGGVNHNNSNADPYLSYAFMAGEATTYWLAWNIGGFQYLQSTATRTLGDVHLIGLLDTGNQKIYHNGKIIGSGTAAITTIVYDTTSEVFIGDYSGVSRNSNAIFLYQYFWNRLLTDGEVVSLYANPYQMFLFPVWDTYIIPTVAPPPTGGKSIFGYDSIFHAGGIIQT